MKKSIFTLIIVVLLSTICYAADFSDLNQDHWAYNNVKRLVENGIVSGYEDGTFRPSNPITRAEFAKMIVRTLDLSGVDEIVFTDIDNHWANAYINIIGKNFHDLEISNDQIKDEWAYKGLYINKRLFKPDEYITRADAVYAIVDALGLSSEEVNISEIGEFSDEIDAWAKNSAYIAKKIDIIKGDDLGNFNPNNSLTRAEVATIICNMIDKLSIDVLSDNLKLVDLINPTPTFSRTSGYPETSSINLNFNDVILSADFDVIDDNGKSHIVYQLRSTGDFISLTVALKPSERYRVIGKNFVTINGVTKPDKEYVIFSFITKDENQITDVNGEFDIIVNKVQDKDELKVSYVGHLAENNAIKLGGMNIKEYDKPGYGGRVYSIFKDTIELNGAYKLMNEYGIPRADKTVVFNYSIIGPSKNDRSKYETIETKTFEYHIAGQHDNEDYEKYVNLDSIILKGISTGFAGIEYATDEIEIEFSENIESIDVDILNSSNESVLVSKFINGKKLYLYTSYNPGKYTLLLKNYVGKDGKKTKKDLVYSYPFEYTGQTSVYTSNEKDPLDVELDIEKPIKVYSRFAPKFNKALKPKQVVYMQISTDYYTGGKEMYNYNHNIWGVLYSAKQRGEYIYGQTFKVTITVKESDDTVLEKSFDVLIPKELEAEAKEKGI